MTRRENGSCTRCGLSRISHESNDPERPPFAMRAYGCPRFEILAPRWLKLVNRLARLLS